MRALEFIADHVIFKLCYNQIYQMKTTMYNVHLPTIYSFWIMQEITFTHNQTGTGKYTTRYIQIQPDTTRYNQIQPEKPDTIKPEPEKGNRKK